MSDRGNFWPASPDWPKARIETLGVTVTASQGDRGVFLCSGPGKAIAELAKAHPGSLLQIASDRALLVTSPDAGPADGWHPSGLAVSTLHDAHVRLDIRGPGALALLQRGSASLALNPTPRSAALSFAGVTLFFEPLPDGARLHVDLPQATHIWHCLAAALSEREEHP